MSIVQKYCYTCDNTTYVTAEQSYCAVCSGPLREAPELHRSIVNKETFPQGTALGDDLFYGSMPTNKAKTG